MACATPSRSCLTRYTWRTPSPYASAWRSRGRMRRSAPTPGGRLLRRVPRRVLTPGEMEQFVLRREEIPAGTQTITFTVEEGAQ